MTNAQKIMLRLSEVRSRLNEISGFEGDALTAEISQEAAALQVEFQGLEVRHRAAIVSETDEEQRAANADDATGEGAELRNLIVGASISAVFGATLEHRQTDGQTAELQQHLKLAPNQIPLALLREPDARMEHRAVTPAPADVGQNLQSVVPGVFPQSCAAFLGIDMPTVGVGEAVFPVLTQNADVGTPAENAAQAETTGSFSADVLSPSRLQASFFYSREDRARFMGMDAALRQNLNDALADALDAQVLAGANGLFTGTNLANHNAAAITSYAAYRSQLGYGRVDGRYAMMVGDLKIVTGSATYAHCAGQFRSDNAGDRAALEDLMSVTGGVKVSAHVPAASGNKQNAVIRLGMRRDMVAPIWEGVTLIPDEITKAANGQIVVTAVMLHAVKILRAAGFYKQQTQHS